eukprot:GHVT01030836.1.p1 GENE.GHVT01030836.1~~GHVT01030836.1.p1  ORF type:complete len:296 (+),score=24.81 GHVT01030836.1:280-1167(+)
MDGLACRLDAIGGYSIPNNRPLGALLYADDILLIDKTSATRDAKIKAIQEAGQEWGAEVNVRKLQWTTVGNADVAPPTVQNVEVPPTKTIRYLGANVTPSGVTQATQPKQLSLAHRSIEAVVHSEGTLPPLMAVHLIRAVGYAQVADATDVTLPDLGELSKQWAKVLARIHGAHFAGHFHRVDIQRDYGLLYHPLYWQLKLLIRRTHRQHISSDFLTQGSGLLRATTSERFYDKENELLAIGGLSREDIIDSDLNVAECVSRATRGFMARKEERKEEDNEKAKAILSNNHDQSDS